MQLAGPGCLAHHCHRAALAATQAQHSIQVIEGSPLLVVSGSAAKRTPVASGLAFSSPRPGFMSLDFLVDGRVLLRVFEDRKLPTVVEVYRRPVPYRGDP